MKIKAYELTCDTLAALAILDKSMEITPEPFRMQKDVTFIFPFTEYIEFIKKYLRAVDYLTTPTNTLIGAYKLNDKRQLYKYYLKDMAVAVCKELHYAEERGAYCSTIRHKSSGKVFYDDDVLHQIYMTSVMTAGQSLRDLMYVSGFPLPKNFNPHNHTRWEYAVVLYFMSTLSVDEWEVIKTDNQ